MLEKKLHFHVTSFSFFLSVIANSSGVLKRLLVRGAMK